MPHRIKEARRARTRRRYAEPMNEETRPSTLSVGLNGAPAHPVQQINLDTWHAAGHDAVGRGVAAIEASAGLVVGTATRPLPDTLAPLVDALTWTFAGPGVADSRRTVTVADPDAAYATLADAVRENPRAAIALGHLVRQTALLPTGPGLAAEAAVYSMLLGGPEFGRWLADRTPPGSVPTPDDDVRLTRTDHVLTVTLNRPERHNALSFALREQLYDALELAVLDDTITRVELAGAGRSFCSGGDLAEFGTADDLVAAYLVRLDRAPWRLLDQLRTRPGTQTHVAVHGAAIGAGAEIAAFGSHVTCTPDAYFRLPEVSMGLVPGAGGTVSVVRRIGRWRAAWLMLTGATIDATTAHAWGLVDEIAP